ncbi:HEAT repeat domain-containing protein [Marinitoga aeolica]|uniref:HEAT repeat domain-containing protein n=1 Tax=Marinitoga aeolica TaxID=2809031 RepID=A0ABY8PTB7_9BACT|nr:HEAT repeat domain-containing protein [Marinitoga aeolica]WGS65862.1 HEAT repeat domain-containing protein [Marinitoga aeolica]
MNIKKMLYSSNEKELLKALEIIAEEQKNKYAKDLFKMLKYENNIIVQEAIINTLKQLNLENIPDELFLNLLSDEKLLLKEFALSLLSISKKIKVLGKLIESEDKDIRKYALDGLYRTKEKEAIKYIAKCLNDPDINNQIAAIEYLGLLGANEYAEEISEKLKTAKNPFLITTILETLSLIGNEKTDKIIDEKIKKLNKPYLIIPYSKYIFSRKNVFECIDFFANNKHKKMIINDFLEYIFRNYKNIKIYQKLKNKLGEILIDILKSEDFDTYKYDILIVLNNLFEDEIEDILKENIKYLNDEGIMAAVEIVNERKLTSLKEDLQEVKEKFSEEVRAIIDDVFLEMKEW